MVTGTVFDIREFAVHDGPGIRTTVFLKGCPLRCRWCHNPEGMSPEPQTMRSGVGERVVGESYTPDRLAELLNRQAEMLRFIHGGVTFSGGEPLMQAEFVAAVIDLLDGMHVVLDTSGYGSQDDLLRLAAMCNLVYYDLKLMDPAEHRKWTGADNEGILANLSALSHCGTPFVVRIPLVPAVTDTPANLGAMAAFLRGMSGLAEVHLLPYNKAAGGKYGACGVPWQPGFDEARAVNADLTPFESAGLAARVQ